MRDIECLHFSTVSAVVSGCSCAGSSTNGKKLLFVGVQWGGTCACVDAAYCGGFTSIPAVNPEKRDCCRVLFVFLRRISVIIVER